MNKLEILQQELNGEELDFLGDNMGNVFDAMEVFAKQQAFLFSEFKNDYQRIEGMNVRHDQIENFGGQMYSWIGASNDVIWEAYKKGEQLKRYFEQ